MEHVENVTMERSVQYSSGTVMEWDGRLRVDSVLSTTSRKATGWAIFGLDQLEEFDPLCTHKHVSHVAETKTLRRKHMFDVGEAAESFPMWQLDPCAEQSTAVWPIPPIHTHEQDAHVAETAKKFEKFASVVNGLMLSPLFICDIITHCPDLTYKHLRDTDTKTHKQTTHTHTIDAAGMLYICGIRGRGSQPMKAGS